MWKNSSWGFLSRTPVPKIQSPTRMNSVDASTGFLDDLGPARFLLPEKGAELGGRGAHRLDRRTVHERLHRARSQRDGRLAVQALDHRGRRALRREHSHPHVELVALDPRLDH